MIRVAYIFSAQNVYTLSSRVLTDVQQKVFQESDSTPNKFVLDNGGHNLILNPHNRFRN